MSTIASRLTEEISSGKYDEKLQQLYGDQQLQEQKERYISLIKAYMQQYGDEKVSIFSAPGRTEVGGNHTDHQRGKVLAAAVDLDAIAVASGTDDNKISVFSQGYKTTASVSLRQLKRDDREKGTSQALVRGLAAFYKSRHFGIGGCHIMVTSNVKTGSGLSSSACFEVLIGEVISGLYNERRRIKPVILAKAGQFAENQYFGKPCGLMDQMACALGGLTYMDFKEDRPKLWSCQLDLAEKGYNLCITDTKGSHSGLTGEYAAVSEEMRRVAAYFGKEVLREVPEEDFYRSLRELRKSVSDRAILRAMHFFNEEKRVEAERAAIEAGDMDTFLKMVSASGRSSFQYLQNIYQSTRPELQPMSLGLALSETVLAGQGAVRVHGGGFAGTIQAFVPTELLEDYTSAMENLYGAGACHLMSIRRYGACQII